MFWRQKDPQRNTLPALTSAEFELSKRLSNHVWLLAGDIGARSLTSSPEGLKKAANYIEHTLRTYGLVPIREEFKTETFSPENRKISANSIIFNSVEHTTWNVIAEIPGHSSAHEIVIIGAHYDSVYDCPAANDNASGVAALLEIANALRGEHPGKTVRFIAFTNEEPPFFLTDQMGSFKNAQNCSLKNEKVVAMLCLETIGFYSNEPHSQKYPHPLMKLIAPNTGNFISFISNYDSADLMNYCLKSFRQSTTFPSKGIALPLAMKGVKSSDHANFWKYNYKAIMVTDTANYRYPHYHESEDTPDKLNYETLARIVSGLTEVVKNLCH